MQKTLTINGKRYTGKQIAKMFDKKNMTNSEEYLVKLGNDWYRADYVHRSEAPDVGQYTPSNADGVYVVPQYGGDPIWLAL